MKKIYPYLILSLSVMFATLIWDYILIPYDENKIIYGDFYSKKYNPINEILRFLIFIFVPLCAFLILKLREKNYYDLNFFSKNFFLIKRTDINFKSSTLNILSLLFVILIIIEFFSLDFSQFANKIDSLHDGVFLVPPKNYIFSGKLWLGTMYDYGVISNNIGLIFQILFDNYTIGSIRFSNLFLILLNKLIIVIICKKLIETTSFEENIKSIFFILLTLFSISLAHYNNSGISPLPPRVFLFLIFLLIIFEIFISNSNLKIKSFCLGIFSLLSLMWYLDIGVYTNFILLILIIYFSYEKKLEILIPLLFGIFFSWVIFFLVFPTDEINEFFFQVKFLASTKDYIIGIEYPKPFSDGSTRYTRALLLVILSGIFLVQILFNKKFRVNYETKLMILLLFISSIIFFKTALGRSDAPHIKYSSGLYLFIIYFSIIFFIMNFFTQTKVSKKVNKFLDKKIYFFLITICMYFFTLNYIDENKNLQKLTKPKKNISDLIKREDKYFLNIEYKSFIDEFRSISENDKCVQIFTGDISITYLLNKPSCTQFYLPAHIITGWTEKRFINQLKKDLPEFIIYSSSNNWLIDRRNMLSANKFILKNYNFFKKINDWEIYKINN